MDTTTHRNNDGYPVFENDVKRHLLERLSAAEGLEKHLDSKYRELNGLAWKVARALFPRSMS